MTKFEIRIGNRPDRMKDSVVAGAAELLGRILEHIGAEDIWTIRPIHQVKNRQGPRFKVIKFDQTTLEVRIKPGDNASCWTWQVLPPGSQNMFVAGRELSLWNGWHGNGNLPDAVVANMAVDEPEPEPLPKEMAEPSNLYKQRYGNPPGLDDDIMSSIEKIGKMKSVVSAYRDRVRKLEGLQVAIGNMEMELLQLQEKFDKLEKEHLADARGKEAVQAMSALALFMQEDNQ